VHVAEPPPQVPESGVGGGMAVSVLVGVVVVVEVMEVALE
jgi:hypothetical protein